MRKQYMGYREAIEWLCLNDDNSWLDDAEPIPSVTASIVADIYRKDTHDVIVSMRNYIKRNLRKQ